MWQSVLDWANGLFGGKGAFQIGKGNQSAQQKPQSMGWGALLQSRPIPVSLLQSSHWVSIATFSLRKGYLSSPLDLPRSS